MTGDDQSATGMTPEVKKLGRIDMNMERREIPSVVLLSRPVKNSVDHGE
jgi:hypothetical protein